MKRQIVVIDSETDPFLYGRIPKPFIWGLYDGKEFRHFETTQLLVDYLEDKNYLIYAHNGGKFDYHFLLDYVNDLSEILIIAGRIARFKIGNCEFRDSYNIIPVPLAKINKDVFDYSKMESVCRAEHMGEIKDYLKNDCVYLYDAIIKFIDEYDLHLTQATAAIKTWEKRGNVVPRSHKGYFSSVRPYYYGGRVTAFRKGVFEGDFKIIDINSAYPRAMLEEHPVGEERRVTKRVLDRDLHKSFLQVEGVSEGALPIRGEKGGLDFPKEKNIFYVTGHEFQAAIETGKLTQHKVLKAYIWEKTINFKDYINYFYNKRLTCQSLGDKSGELFAKFLMNSLYGKFASDPSKYEEHLLGYYSSPVPDTYSPSSIIGNRQLFSRKLQEGRQRYYDIAIAASITGWVRAFLLRSLTQVENPLYCDTDSIICSNTGSLSLGNKLGEWKLEGEANSVAIAGKKMYACRLKDGEYKMASKGVRLKPSDIFDIANGNTVTYKPDAPTFSVKRPVTFIDRKITMT